jgi:hypothetical protein
MGLVGETAAAKEMRQGLQTRANRVGIGFSILKMGLVGWKCYIRNGVQTRDSQNL